MNLLKVLTVDTSSLPLEAEPVYQKLFPIFKTRVEERSGAAVGEGISEFTVSFSLDASMQEEAFDIRDIENGVSIIGKNFNALMFGMGQLLHKSRYDENGMYLTDWRGSSAPECPFRFLYLAIHFYNWYYNTTPEELVRYCEDVMLWGYNGFCGVFAKINLNGWNDPGVDESFALLKKLFSIL